MTKIEMARCYGHMDHVEIGYKYNCSHPMMTYLCDSSLKYKSEGAYSLVYVKFSGEVRLWGK